MSNRYSLYNFRSPEPVEPTNKMLKGNEMMSQEMVSKYDNVLSTQTSIKGS